MPTLEPVTSVLQELIIALARMRFILGDCVDIDPKFTLENIGAYVDLEKVAYRSLGHWAPALGLCLSIQSPISEEPRVVVEVSVVATAPTCFPSAGSSSKLEAD